MGGEGGIPAPVFTGAGSSREKREGARENGRGRVVGTGFTPIPTFPHQGGRGLRAGKGMGPRIREDKVGVEHWLSGGGCLG